VSLDLVEAIEFGFGWKPSLRAGREQPFHQLGA